MRFPRGYVSGEAEVGDLDVVPVVGLREQHVFGLQIAMDDALFVAVAQRVEQRAHHDLRFALGIGFPVQNRVEQLAALRQFLDYIKILRVLQKVLQRDHVRVRTQLVHDAALPLQSTPAGIIHFQRGDVAVAEVGLADDFGGNDFAGGGEDGLADDSVLSVAENVAEGKDIRDDAVGGFELGETDGVHVGHGVVEAVDETGDEAEHGVGEVHGLGSLEFFEEGSGARKNEIMRRGGGTRLSG